MRRTWMLKAALVARNTENRPLDSYRIRKYLGAMATLLENGFPASRVMEAIKGPLVIKQE